MFYSIPNLTSQTACELPEPWTFQAAPEAGTFTDKAAFKSWCQDPGTKHSFLSTVEGMSKNQRVSYENHNVPFALHGFIVDYDSPVADDAVERMRVRPQSDFKPEWFVKTFSGNARLIWVFEKPLLIVNKDQYKAFALYFKKKVKLQAWLAGFEAEALGDAVKYYELGKEWKQAFPGARVPFDTLTLWAFEASRKLALDENPRRFKIPFEDIAKAVEERFPGRWSGPFEPGRRGLRFWDPTAQDETGAIVRDDGVHCFSGTEGFMSWAQIFGAAFVEKYEADRISDILDKTVYDGKDFWTLKPQAEEWIRVGKEDFSQTLRTDFAFNPARGKDTHSEVDEVECAIKSQRRVERAVPILFHPTGIINLRGEVILNTTAIRPMPPAPPCTDGKMTWCDGAKHWPFIFSFLRALFHTDQLTQLERLLSYMKYAYTHALDFDPRQGQAMILAGVVGKGKTMFVKGIFAPLMGGDAIDGSGYLIEGCRWTAHLAKAPILLIDDDVVLSGDQKALNAFTARVKKLVATGNIVYEQKYGQVGEIPYFSRTVVLCNLDMESMRILPNMDSGTKEKIMLFKASETVMDFPDYNTIKATLAKELPFFGRFLVDMEYPADALASEKRFKIKAYHHPDLLDEARQQGAVGVLLEVLDTFLRAYAESHRGAKAWVGVLTQLLNELQIHNPAVMRGVNANQLRTSLGIMVRNGYGLWRDKGAATGSKVWNLNINIREKVGTSEREGGEGDAGTGSERGIGVAEAAAEGLHSDSATAGLGVAAATSRYFERPSNREVVGAEPGNGEHVPTEAQGAGGPVPAAAQGEGTK